MEQQTLYADSSTLLTRVTPGTTMTILPVLAAIMVPFIASAPYALRMKSSPFTPSVTSLTTRGPHALTFYSPVVSVNALFVKIPICIFASMLSSSPPTSLHTRHHPACQPHDVVRLAETLDNFLLKSNHFYMLPHPFAFNSIALLFLIQ